MVTGAVTIIDFIFGVLVLPALFLSAHAASSIRENICRCSAKSWSKIYRQIFELVFFMVLFAAFIVVANWFAGLIRTPSSGSGILLSGGFVLSIICLAVYFRIKSNKA